MFTQRESLDSFKNRFYSKYPYSEYKILKQYKCAKGFKKSSVYVLYNKTVFLMEQYVLLRGIKPNYSSAVNKVQYLTNQVKLRFPENLKHYNIKTIISATNVIIETKFGLCKTTSSNILKGQLFRIPTALDKTTFFKKQYLDKHPNTEYNIDNIIYKGYDTKIEVICKTHGVFKIKPDHFLLGIGCNSCNIENPLGWNTSAWFKKASISKKYKAFTVYIIECYNKNEKFYKIGRTFIDVMGRFPCQKSLPYEYKIIETFEFKDLIIESAEKAFDLEKSLKNLNKIHLYKPLIYFKGHTECFKQIIKNENKINNKLD